MCAYVSGGCHVVVCVVSDSTCAGHLLVRFDRIVWISMAMSGGVTLDTSCHDTRSHRMSCVSCLFSSTGLPVMPCGLTARD
eukprot:9723245-Lingulodinium_polyedra.AAC.1